jgi:hypothetical protein
MLANLSSLTTLEAEWHGVVRMREHVRHLVVSTFADDAIRSPAFANILYNLPLLLAFEVLMQVLLQARENGRFMGSQLQLGDLMDSAKTSLPWIDWQRLREAVKRRNEVTHDCRIFGNVQCLQDIADIEAQLVAWGIISAA